MGDVNKLSRILAVLFFSDGVGVGYIPELLEDYVEGFSAKMTLLHGRAVAGKIAREYQKDPNTILELRKNEGELIVPPDEAENLWVYILVNKDGTSVLFSTLKRFAQREEKIREIGEKLLRLFYKNKGISDKDIKSVLDEYSMD